MAMRPALNPLTPDDHGAWLTIVTSMLLVWMLTCLIVRWVVRTRYTGPWGLDDNVILVATIFACAQVAATYVSVHNGFGRREIKLDAFQVAGVQKALYASQILYIVAITVAKCSTALLVVRLTRTRKHKTAGYALTGLTALWGLISVLVLAIRGQQPWTWASDIRANIWARWLGIEIFSMLIEIALVGLSLFLVWGLQMAVKLKSLVVGAFGIRLLGAIPWGVRLYYLRPSFNMADPSFNLIYAAILTQVVMQYCLMSATVPCLKPIIRPFRVGYMADSEAYTDEYGHSRGTRSSQGKSYVLHSWGTEKRKSNPAPPRQRTFSPHRRHSMPFAGPAQDVITIIEHPVGESDMSDSLSRESDGQDQMVVRQHKAIEITYERSDESDQAHKDSF